MIKYVLITTSDNTDLILLAQKIARQRKAILYIFTEKTPVEYADYVRQFNLKRATLLFSDSIAGTRQFVEGPEAIVKFLREEQYKTN